MIGPAGMVIGIALSGCNAYGVLAFVCASLFLNGAVTAGYLVNHTDISPVFSG